MEKISFLVRGSEEHPYKVEFQKTDNGINAWCSCKAASMNQHCKHRIEILKGIDPGIVSDNKTLIKTVSSWSKGSEVEKVMTLITNKEKDLDSLKKEVKGLKKQLGKILIDAA